MTALYSTIGLPAPTYRWMDSPHAAFTCLSAELPPLTLDGVGTKTCGERLLHGTGTELARQLRPTLRSQVDAPTWTWLDEEIWPGFGQEIWDDLWYAIYRLQYHIDLSYAIDYLVCSGCLDSDPVAFFHACQHLGLVRYFSDEQAVLDAFTDVFYGTTCWAPLIDECFLVSRPMTVTLRTESSDSPLRAGTTATIEFSDGQSLHLRD